MNLSNYAAERASDLPVFDVSTLSVEEITLTDLSPAQQQAEYKLLLTEDEQDDFMNDLQKALDDEEFDEEGEDEPSYNFCTNSFAYGFDPTELDADSGHRAFCNNFDD